MSLPSDLMNELTAALGPDNAVWAPAAVEERTRSCLPQSHIPDGVVTPRTLEEVRAVLAAARKHNVPVWTISTGKNWGYGEKAAPYAGGLTMELSRMNRILEVNERLGYAVIEPGVTYARLHDHLRVHAPSLWTDSSGSTKDASVIGNALDKGRGLTPYADHFGALCGLEVVLADGRVVRTGGGPDNNRCWNLYKWGVGPYLDGLFAQSNLGVVVKAGVWLMPAPARYDFMAFEYTAGADRFPAFIEDFRSLIFQNAIRSRPHLANDFAMLCIVSQYPHDLAAGNARSPRRPWRPGGKSSACPPGPSAAGFTGAAGRSPIRKN